MRATEHPLLRVLDKLACFAIIACGNNENRCKDGQALVVEARDVVLLAYRDGIGEWQTFDGQDDDQQICVNNDYVIVAVCDDGVRFHGEQIAATVEDAKRLVLNCNPEIGVTINGEMVQAGSVWLRGSVGAISSVTAQWTFEFAVPKGLHDLIATDFSLAGPGGDRVGIRRGLQVSADTRVEPAVDLDMEGQLTRPVEVMLSNLEGDESQATAIEWHTIHSAAVISDTDGFLARAVPLTLLESGDRQFVYADASGSLLQKSTSRGVYSEVGSETSYSFELLPRLADEVSFEDGPAGLKASWSQLPVEDPDWFLVRLANDVGSWRLHASAAWIVARGVTEIGLDLTTLGLQDRWIIHGTEASTSFEITQERDGIERDTRVTDRRAGAALR